MGLIMDEVRTPYRRRAYLDPDGKYEVTLQWYPAPPGARWFPGPHLFASADWSEQRKEFGWPPPGEKKGSQRRFYAGLGPCLEYTGQGPPLGDPSWYLGGVPAGVIEEALRNPPPPPPGFPAPGPGPRVVCIKCGTPCEKVFCNQDDPPTVPRSGLASSVRSLLCDPVCPWSGRGGTEAGCRSAGSVCHCYPPG